MRYLLVVLFLTAAAMAGTKQEVFVIESVGNSQSYEVPASAMCLPGTYGPMCGARGAATAYVYDVRIKARIGDEGVWLTCRIVRNRDTNHCGNLSGNHAYTAEAKGKDRLIVYAWKNPMYKGDMSKATKLEYAISARPLEDGEKAARAVASH